MYADIRRVHHEASRTTDFTIKKKIKIFHFEGERRNVRETVFKLLTVKSSVFWRTQANWLNNDNSENSSWESINSGSSVHVCELHTHTIRAPINIDTCIHPLIICYMCEPHTHIIRDYKSFNSCVNARLTLLLYVCVAHMEASPFTMWAPLSTSATVPRPETLSRSHSPRQKGRPQTCLSCRKNDEG